MNFDATRTGGSEPRPFPSFTRARAQAGKDSRSHAPSTQTRNITQLAIAAGFTQQQVAGLIGISVPTLRKHYRAELQAGRDTVNLKVVANIYRIAMQTEDPEAAIAAGRFICRARLGWVETSPVSARLRT